MNLGGVIHLRKTGVCVLGGLILIILIYSTSHRRSEKNGEDNNLVDLHKLLEVAIKAAEYGGKKVVETKDTMKVKSKGLTREGLQDSVTTADFLSHCAMTSILRHHFAALKIVSEENHSCKDSELQSIDFFVNTLEIIPKKLIDIKDITVWIDPLDATHEYAEKSESLYKYITTMICIAVKDKPLIGIIHKPFEKITSWAWVGEDMSEDLKQKKNLEKETNDEVKIIISRSHQGEIEKMLKQNFKGKFQLVVAAGAGYKALEVAYGNVNAYMHSTAIKKWDICAGNAIIAAKEGQMTTKYNKQIDYSDSINVKNEDGIVATLQNHENFIKLM